MPPYSPPDQDATLRRQSVVAGVCLVLAILALNLPDRPRQAVSSALKATVLRPFNEMQRAVRGLQMRASEAEALRAQNDSLIAVLIGAGGVVDELRQARELLGLTERLPTGWVAGTVIRVGTEGSESTFLISVADGIRLEPGAPVVTADGLMGRVQERTVGGSALAIDWTHPDFRASAMTDDGSAFGIVRALRGSFREEDQLELQGSDFHTLLDPGTLVRTSGGTGVFPRGIPIGIIEGPSRTEEGWRRDYRLRPAVHPAGVSHVLVAVQGVDGVSVLTSAWPRELPVQPPTAQESDTTTIPSSGSAVDTLAPLDPQGSGR